MENQSIIVIENSADCNLKCPACPTRYAYDYPRQFMDMETFYRVIQNICPQTFPRCALMGWGEPFLDPLYSQKLLSLKHEGFYVGSTTNCTLLTHNKTEEILDCGLDYLGISLDINHLNGLQTHCHRMEKKIENLVNTRERKQSEMKISINVVLFRTEKESLFDLLDHVQGYPVCNISVTPLIMIPSQKFYPELTPKDELEDLNERIKERFSDLPIFFHYLEQEIKKNCRSDVFNNVYVDYLGNVCPCCVLAMRFPNITFDGQMHDTEIFQFGNLTNTDIETIWNSKNYKDFRQVFIESSIPSACQCCNAWRILPQVL